LAGLSACQTASLPPPLEVPAGLLTCEPEPPRISLDGATQRDAAVYVLRLREAGQDCRDALATVRGYVTAAASGQAP
jgi:hypothetical protein